jgi:two-component system LytT family response regulator
MINVILIDDEEGAIEALELMLKKHCPHINIVGFAHDIHEGYREIESKKPDLVFLDINMPNGLGLELVEKISHLDVSVVFTTAHQEYAINAIRLSAVDYLLKPLKSKELIEAVVRYEEKVSSKNGLSVLKELLTSPQKLERLAIPNVDGIEIIKRADICYLEADRNYTKFHLVEGKKIVASKPIGDYEKLLHSHGFIRAHRSYLINVEHVQKFNRRTGTLMMSDGQEIDVSRNRRDEIIMELGRSA